MVDLILSEHFYTVISLLELLWAFLNSIRWAKFGTGVEQARSGFYPIGQLGSQMSLTHLRAFWGLEGGIPH